MTAIRQANFTGGPGARIIVRQEAIALTPGVPSVVPPREIQAADLDGLRAGAPAIVSEGGFVFPVGEHDVSGLSFDATCLWRTGDGDGQTPRDGDLRFTLSRDPAP